MKEKIIPFIKKYPMSILLAIIAINLFSIGESLKRTARTEEFRELCSKRYSYYHEKKFTEATEIQMLIQKKASLQDIDQASRFCSYLTGAIKF